MKLLLGNEAFALGAVSGGVSHFAGYPLAPTSEIHACFLRLLPARGGTASLVEDVPAAVAAALGAGAGGGVGATALTVDALGPAEELLRAGIEARWAALLAVIGPGAEGPAREAAPRLRVRSSSGTAPVWVPWSPQECHDLARSLAGAARLTRSPVLVYTDAAVAHLREPVAHATDEEPSRGDPSPAEHYRTRDAQILLLSFGIAARAARTAVRLARDRGLRAGLFRAVRLWPFPWEELAEVAARDRSLHVVEPPAFGLAESLAAEGIARAERLAIRPLAMDGLPAPGTILTALGQAA